MDVATFIFLGLLALVWTVLSALPPSLWDEETQTAFTLLGSIFWAVWAISSGDVVVHSGGTEFSHGYEALLILGGVLALFLFVVTVDRVLGLVNQRGD